ncbi:uncharacterized protein KY384_008836 [Bacidia gigantensis]|uniref:uncharacterized protein n=1 Tax=Bacidia gigantensis TaxID=2732470 RepID=UPI001D03E1CA|nr:uncharacterized protein KY384_008836 [Bacidia gigantensis]KAG8525192.1 hypothetical protein KY384_008836 [Bacidia gigantensis]
MTRSTFSDREAFSTSLLVRCRQSVKHQPVRNINGREKYLEVKCSWSPVIHVPETKGSDYAVVSVQVSIDVRNGVGDDCIRNEESNCLKELLTTVESMDPLIPGTSWLGRVFLVVPIRSGYLARTRCFHGRFAGCADLGVLLDRTVFGQRVSPVNSHELQELFGGCLFMLVRPDDQSRSKDDAFVLEEINARINFRWLLDVKPKQKTLALIDGHLNLKSYLPLYHSAIALGINLVVFDRPGHFLTDPSMQHLYSDFVPIDMTIDNSFHVRIAAAVKAYGKVDGLCAIASACLAPVARAAVILGLPAEPPEAIACASNKYESRIIAGGAAPMTLVKNVPDLEQQMATREFIPQYPLIVKPEQGAGSAHVYKVDTQTELLEAVRRTDLGSGKQVLVEAYIEGPELDVNFILLDGQILFFEVSDDFPSPGDDGSGNKNFGENANVLPSKLPATELALVRQELHQFLLQIGLKTGVYHLEARVQNSSMVFKEKGHLVDLRPKASFPTKQSPRCVLIEANPRPPGFQSVLATAGAYGVNMYDAHLLACLGDYGRLQAFAKPFELDSLIPHHARAWSQILFFRAERGGICAPDDVCGETLGLLSPEDRALVTESLCFFERGERIPEPRVGIITMGALERRLLFAVPKKSPNRAHWVGLSAGRLNRATLNLLEGADIHFSREHHLDIALVMNLPIALVFLPAADIPTFVGQGRVDLGVTGYDQVQEHEVGIRTMQQTRRFSDEATSGEIQRNTTGSETIMDVGFGACKLQLQVPENGRYQTPHDLIGKNIGTSFVHLTREYFRNLENEIDRVNDGDTSCNGKIRTNIVELSGKSGETMKAAGLKPIDTVVKSSAILIKSRSPSNTDLVDLIAARIRGVITAQEFVLCQYNIERKNMAAATAIAPGKRAPTIIALDEEGWIAVSVMVEKRNIAPIMDQLTKVGATDIMELGITNTR